MKPVRSMTYKTCMEEDKLNSTRKGLSKPPAKTDTFFISVFLVSNTVRHKGALTSYSHCKGIELGPVQGTGLAH